MTGRERLRAVLERHPTDRLPWTVLVDDNTLDLCPAHMRGNGGIDFCRHLGCDILLLNGWNTPHVLESPSLVRPENVRTETLREGTRTVRKWHTPGATLTAVWDRGHPVKYPVGSIRAVRAYHRMWQAAEFQERDDSAAMIALDRLLGESGVVTRFWGPSTIPRLLESDMGVENFYFMLHDHPDEMDALIETMHAREMDAFRCLAEGPWESVTLCENTSTHYISPDVYERYNMRHQRDFVTAVHEAGKPALLHMCGHVRDILDLIAQTGCDGIHALTPPPTGNTPWESALDVMGEELIIVGALDPSVFAAGDIRGIAPLLDRIVTPRLREAHFILCAFADGIAVAPERFEIVRHWMEDKGVAAA